MSKKRLAEFWDDPRHPKAKVALANWYKVVLKARWENFGEVKKTFNAADLVGNKTVFDVGGNNYRVVAVINFENHTVFIRAVLDHKEYDKGNWKKDDFQLRVRRGKPKSPPA